MITAIVQFKLSPFISRDRVQEDFSLSHLAPTFRTLPGLIRKYFLLSKDGTMAGGVYLWKSQADGEHFYTDEFKKSITDRYGSEPSITYFESPIVVDNLISTMNVTG